MNEEEIVKSKLAEKNGQMTATADNGNNPGEKLSGISINDLLATGSHTTSGEFQQENPAADQADQPKESTETAAFKEASKTAVGSLIGGELAVDLLDMIIPVLFVFVGAKIGYALDKKGLQLTAKEKAVLHTPVQQVLDRLLLDLNNPYYNLAVVMIIVYGSKVVEQIPDIKKIVPKEEREFNQIKEIEKKVEQIENATDLTGQEKYDAELKIKLREEQKRSKQPYAKIITRWEKDGTIDKLKKKHHV